MTNSRQLLVIVVNWNTSDLLRECLVSLRRAREESDFSVAVVDNGSSDNSAAMVRTLFPEFSLLPCSENLGFAKANNRAIRQFPDFEFYLLLNSDATVTSEVIAQLMQFAESHPGIAAVGPALRLPNGRFQTGGAGWGPRAWHALNTYLLLAQISRHFRGLYMIQEQYKRERSRVLVDWLAGACMLVPRRAFTAIGLLDERYFVYGEDAEWCWRARQRGWKIAYLPYVTAIHNYRGSADSAIAIRPNWFRNLSDAVRMSSSNLNYRVFLFMSLAGYAIRMVALAPVVVMVNRTRVREKFRSYGLLLRESFRLITNS